MGSQLAGRWRLAVVLCLLSPGVVWAQPTTTRVSVGPGGVEANGSSASIPIVAGHDAVISGDGRWVAFVSMASNLVAGDTNGMPDVFVRDLQTATTTRVSVGAGGVQANSSSWSPAMSADGRWVAFSSGADNLVAGDTNTRGDVFVHDQQTGTTTRVSLGPGGVQANADSGFPTISADGRWVAFESYASNLVAGDTNGRMDIFVHDRQTATTTRASVGSGDVQGNGESRFATISGDGRWVAFMSNSSNLVAADADEFDVFVHDRQTGTTTRLSVGPTRDAGFPVISADGRWVAFTTSWGGQAFVHDQQTGTTTLASIGPGGAPSTGAASAISSDGRWVVLTSEASNLVAGDTNGAGDVFVRDRQMETTTRVSVASGGIQANGSSFAGSISADGRWIVFPSIASNLVAGDTNGMWDVFAHDRRDRLPPAPPEGLVASSVAGSLITVRWTIPSAGPTPTGFLLEGGLSPGQVLASLPTGSAAPTFTFAAPSGSFFVRMHALNGASRSPASNEIRIHVNVPVAPSAPANLLGLVNGSALSLAWRNTFAGGAPTSLVLDVTGAITTSVPLGLTDTFSFAGVPAGTYTLSLRAVNAAGSGPPSNLVTLTFPGPCSGAPDPPANVFAYAEGRTVFVDWTPAATGTAPTSYVLNVAGSYVGAFAVATRGLSGAVGPGSYTLSVAAVNACGTSTASAPQTVTVP